MLHYSILSMNIAQDLPFAGGWASPPSMQGKQGFSEKIFKLKM
jgi:hypothetical protein